MEPTIFGSKEDHWPKFREDLMDYADAVHPGLRLQLEWVLKQKDEVTAASMRGNPLGTTEAEWELRAKLYMLLKIKTEATTDARKIVECVEQSNGFEAWRLLGVRFEPQAGMKRLAELGELMSLRDKRCKNTNETALIVLELDRRKKIIAEAGGKPPDEDVTINILWMSMDPSTKAHVTGKVDMDLVTYVELRQIVQSYTNLINSTSGRGKGNGVVPMDIGSIASVAETSAGNVISDSAWPEGSSHCPPAAVWSLDDAG